MKVIEQLSDLDDLKFPIVTSGTFDGVHYGHRQILERLVQDAGKFGGESVVLTYWPHPRFVLGNKDLKLLSTIDEKIELLDECGIDYLIKIRFTRDFSELSSDHFIQKIIVDGIGTRKLILGYDHKFGRDREGSFDYLMENQQRFNFELEEIPKQEIEDVAVSSTKIRQALFGGDVLTAREYLGRHYSIQGLVVKGKQVGRTIGFPTANVYVPEDYKLIPADGVYAVKVELGEDIHSGMLNIGFKPTLEGHEHTIEANIFNFEQDIYGQDIKIKFVNKIRNEIKFDGIQSLKEQLNQDKVRAQKLLENEKS